MGQRLVIAADERDLQWAGGGGGSQGIGKALFAVSEHDQRCAERADDRQDNTGHRQCAAESLHQPRVGGLYQHGERHRQHGRGQ